MTATTTTAVDHWPYWRATTGRVHRVREVKLFWTESGTFLRPRILIEVACNAFGLHPTSDTRRVSGLTPSREGDPCAICFSQEAVPQ